jgi:hypothetical protein
MYRIRPWVEVEGGYDHYPIPIQLEKQDCKHVSSFKFNPSWIEEDKFQELVKREWINYYPNSRETIGSQFTTSLKKLKELVVAWASNRHEILDKDL